MSIERPSGFVPGLPNCGIVALAAATGNDYAAVWDWFKARGKRRASWRGRTRPSDYLTALYHFGFTKSAVQTSGVGRTIAQFADQHTVRGSTYIVCTSGHTLAIRDGVVLDNHKIAPAAEHPSARRIVKKVWLVAA